MLAVSRALFALLVGAVLPTASRSTTSCALSSECGIEAASWVNLLQHRYIRERRDATTEQAGGDSSAQSQLANRAEDATEKEKLHQKRAAGGHQQKFEASLASVSSRVSGKQQKNGPKDPNWFQAFSEDESTYDTDGELQASGWDSNNWAPGEEVSGYLPLKPTPMPGKWFQESRSGGPSEAWQTFYPPVPDTKPRGRPNSDWKETVYGGYQQSVEEFDPAQSAMHWSSEKENKPAMWFDTAVGQYDAFGRSRAPSEHSQRRYIDWDKRTQKVNLQCSSVGCIAHADFPQLFNHSEEQRRLCLLSIAIHATDFDDEYSREKVEFFTANGETVGVNCDPMTQGNTPEAQEPLYSCVSEVNIDHILKDDGKLDVEGKLNSMVDEFPRNGNLLDGVATVSCLVRKRPDWHPAEPKNVDAAFNKTLAELFKPQNISKQFGCATPGCTAEATLELGTQAIVNRTCQLTVKISQTDFDGNMGTEEQVEFLKVNGKTLKEGVKPGKNPCHEAAALGQQPPNTSKLVENASNATNLSAMPVDQNMFTLLDKQDVSEEAKTGKITISSKISDMVDECGYEGLLLSGIAELYCEVSGEHNSEGEAAKSSSNATGNATSDASSNATSNATEAVTTNSTAAAAANASAPQAGATGQAASSGANATANSSQAAQTIANSTAAASTANSTTNTSVAETSSASL